MKFRKFKNDSEKISEIKGVEDFRTALEFGGHKRVPQYKAIGLFTRVSADTCNDCEYKKGPHEWWPDHKISENYI